MRMIKALRLFFSLCWREFEPKPSDPELMPYGVKSRISFSTALEVSIDHFHNLKNMSTKH